MGLTSPPKNDSHDLFLLQAFWRAVILHRFEELTWSSKWALPNNLQLQLDKTVNRSNVILTTIRIYSLR